MSEILSMSAEQYRAAAGVSKSMLDDIAPPWTPAHFRAKHITKEVPDDQTDAQELGQLTHRVILEPDTLEGAFHVKPEGMNFTTKAGKEWRDGHTDRPIITTGDANAVKAMRDAVWRHPVAKRLLKGARTEQSLFAEDSRGTLRKGRLDALTEGNIIPDLKTCLSADPAWLEKQVANLRYYVQGAYYAAMCNLLGMDKQAFTLICVEKTPPYDVVCYTIEDWLMDAGKVCFERDLAMYRHCLETDKWPGRSDGIEYIGVPQWARKELEAMA